MASPERSSNGLREGLPCSLCECLKFQNGEPMSTNCNFHSILFHNPCEICTQNIGPSDCCAFCQHLRIRHLLICLSEWGSLRNDYENLKHFKVELGSIVELQSRQPCPLCRFFFDLMTSRYKFWQETIPEEGNPVLLEFSRNGPALRVLGKVQKAIRFSVRDMRKHYGTPATLSSKVDWGTLHGWKREYMHTPTPRLPQSFLVIDVENGCVVSKSKSCTYAALSYVWGNPKSKPRSWISVALSYVWGNPTQGELQASLANISNLKKPGALKKADIPLAILDAMTAASELKIPYLWVDRFCIVQDDPQTKHDLINQMDSIYASALVTFVTGAGKDASYGLPGVSSERSPGQAHIRIQGVELTGVLPTFVNDILPRMVWNERGWTYQEAMFSANLIFFTDYGVFYERTNSASGKILTESPNLHENSVFSATTKFFKSVEAYSRRTLSYETDIERAFSGVLQSHYGKEHAYGSPLRSFDVALRWNPRNKRRGTRRSTGDDIFPSWSWLSVMGRVDFSEIESAKGSLPVATWAMNLRREAGKSEICFIGAESEGDFEYNSLRVDGAWDAGFFEGERRSYPREGTALDDNSPWSESIWKSYKSFWIESRGLKLKSTPSRLGFAEKYPLCLRPGHVLVRTQSAYFPERLFFPYESESVSGIDEWVDDRDSETQQQCDGSRERGHAGAIALSFTESFDPSSEDDEYDDPELDRPDKYYGYENNWRVNVMRIRHVDGVAYRTGLGSVTLQEWKAAEPRFETIILG